MIETVVAEPVDVHVASEPPPAQLPAVRQERKPSTKRALGKAIEPLAPVFPSKIALAILKITREIGAVQKEGYNDFQKYKYTRWEDICEKLSPLLAEHGLIIVQAEQSRDLIEETDKGSVLAIVYRFSLINEQGEQWPPVEWTAIARLRDQKGITDDKAAAKCHTQAEKQFVIKLFKIRSDDGMDDGDQHSTLPKKDARDVYQKLQKEIDEQTSIVALDAWGKENSERMHVLPKDWQGILRDRFLEKRGDLENQIRGNPEYHDEETGEIIDSAGDAEPAAPVKPAPQPSAAGAAVDILVMAREAAERGADVFNNFYKARTAAEKKRINTIGDELRALMGAAAK